MKLALSIPKCCGHHQPPHFSYPADLVRLQYITQQFTDVAVDNATNPSTISILIKALKTDQSWKGFKAFVGFIGKTYNLVTALMFYLTLRWIGQALVPVKLSESTQVCKTFLISSHVSQSFSSSIHRPQFQNRCSNHRNYSWSALS